MNKKLKKYSRLSMLIGYACLLFIHFILRDSYFPLSVIFYAFPLLILIGIGGVLLLLFFRRKKYRIVLTILLVVLSLSFIKNYYFSTETIVEKHFSKVLFWNVAKKTRLPIETISKQVHIHQPEILAFVEVTRETFSNLDSLKTKLPNYNFKRLQGAMLVGTKNEVKILDFKVKTDLYKINVLEITTARIKFKFIVTDLTAYLHVNKKEILDYVLNVANKNDVDAIIGDFNTPFESVHFNDFYKNYQSFHSYNDGFTATWPLGIPLFEIDHIWLSKKHQPIKLYKDYNNDSDHALLISHFIINKPKSQNKH